MADQAPHVSVFHFTSRISNAKIKKYKLATERGMTTRGVEGESSASPAPPTPSLPAPSTTTFVMQPGHSPSTEPPAKKQRLKLNVRDPNTDTIAVSQPIHPPGYKIRYSENMTIDANNKLSIQTFQEPKPSPPVLHQRPSLPPFQPPPNRPPEPTKAPADLAPAAPSKKQSDYGSFASYYITGDDEEDDAVPSQGQPSNVAPKPHEQPLAAKPHAPVRPQPSFQQAPPPLPPPKPKHQMLPPPQAPAPTMPAQRPSVDVVDDIRRAPIPSKPDTIKVMIEKLEALSAALATFGGVPRAPNAAPPASAAKDAASKPQPQTKKKSEGAAGKKAAAVDDLLAMFDGDDSDDADDKSEGSSDALSDPPDDLEDEENPLDRVLENVGEQDAALIYGIQFIQNALKSWAKQRLNNMYAQEYHGMVHRAMQSQPPRRGPGRPRKFDAWDDERIRVPLPPLHIQLPLSQTQEGIAISAFQSVMDSGCLQVNARMPKELSEALRHLYLQIDRLINQGVVGEPQWKCMSYGAQIKAHRQRVDKMKDHHARAQEEMVRQQQLAQEHMLQRMGVPHGHLPSVPMTAEQAQHAHAMELERRRSHQQATQQPHLKQYLSNPLDLDKRSQNSPEAAILHQRAASSSRSPATEVPPTHRPTHSISSFSVGNAALARSVSASDQSKHLSPNLLLRSGQSMKFSFQPQNQQALGVFGKEAFPASSRSPTHQPTDSLAQPINHQAATASSAPRPPSAKSLLNGQALSSADAPNVVRRTSDVHMQGQSPSPASPARPHGKAPAAPAASSPDRPISQKPARGWTAVNAAARAAEPSKTNGVGSISAGTTHAAAAHSGKMSGDGAAETGHSQAMELD